MIDRQTKALFVHIPKTGGQSIEHVFLALNGLSWDERAPLLLRRNKDPERGPARMAHLLAREYVDCAHLTPQEYGQLFSFAFVRNPWDRLVSAYRYHCGEEQSFARFVDGFLGYRESFSNRARHAIPQADYLCDAAGNVMVNFVGKFETLAQDFASVAQELSLPSAQLPHRNASSGRKGSRSAQLLSRLGLRKAAARQKRHYSDYYTPALIDRVGEFYRRDVELFDYRFMPADAHTAHPAQAVN